MVQSSPIKGEMACSAPVCSVASWGCLGIAGLRSKARQTEVHSLQLNGEFPPDGKSDWRTTLAASQHSKSTLLGKLKTPKFTGISKVHDRY